jgi:hypothetical protein
MELYATIIGALAATALALSAAPPPPQDSEGLGLVFSDPFGIVFMRPAEPGRPVPTAPVEVMHWTFFDAADRLTTAWGWKSVATRARIDCQAGHMSPLRHQTYMDGEPVETVTPPFRMQAPVGDDKEAILAYVCDPQVAPPETVVADMAAARAWADAAFLAMKDEGE